MLHFGQLSDGTEASIADLVFQEIVVVSVSVVVGAPSEEHIYFDAAQALRMHYPELNRTDVPGGFMGPCPFDRVMLDDAEASQGVRVEHVASLNLDDRILAILAEHPLRLGLLRWRILVSQTNAQDSTTTVALAVSHSDADGMGAHVMLASYLQLLFGHQPSIARGPLFSSLPRDRVHFSLVERAKAAAIAVAAALFGRWIAVKWSDEDSAPSSRVGIMDLAKAEVDADTMLALKSACKRRGVRIGSLLMAVYCKLAGTPKLGISVDMRTRLQPPIPVHVAAPQQGSVMVNLKNHEMGNIWDLGKQAQQEVDAALAAGPSTLLFDELVLANITTSWANQSRGLTYLDSDWLSNCGVFPVSLPQLKRAWIINRPVVPAYRLVWATTVANGPMVLSQIADTSMFGDSGKMNVVDDMVALLKDLSMQK